MWRVRHLIVLAAAVGAGIVLSACGGDSSPETPIAVPTGTSQASAGKAEFIAQADSACAEVNASIEQFAAAGQGETQADQIAQLRQGVVDQIKQLGPPDEDSATLDQFLAAMSDEVTAGQKIGLAVQRGEDPTQFETELDNAKSQAESAASAYGFQECGSPITASSTTSSGSPSSGSSSSSGAAVTPSTPSSSGTSGTPSGTAGGTPGGSDTSGSSGTSDSSGSGGTGGGNSGGIGPG
jgi:hypothetical protein